MVCPTFQLNRLWGSRKLTIVTNFKVKSAIRKQVEKGIRIGKEQVKLYVQMT